MNSFELLEYLLSVINDEITLIIARLKENSFIRKRGMTFQDALTFLLDMRKTTLQTRLNLYFKCVKEGEPISQQAFSKLRMNFDHSPFESMVRGLVKKEYSGDYDLPLWNGYHICSIDGSTMQLPRTDELREEFGTRGQGKTCPCAGVSILYDVLNGWVLDPSINKADMNERVECEKHISFMCRELPHIKNKSIILLDRGYPSLDLLEKLQTSGLKYLARCSSMFLSEINNAPAGDSIVVLKNGISVRILKLTLPFGEIETLVTNLFELPESLFCELYSMRWGVETAYYRLKQEICVEKFSGKTPNSIRQDFWASMVLMLSVAVFKREADSTVRDRQKDKELKHMSRARTSDLIVTLRDRFIFASLCEHPGVSAVEMNDIIKTLARVVSPVRPGRKFPRLPKPHLEVNHNLKSHL
jgi:hypothetical protein